MPCCGLSNEVWRRRFASSQFAVKANALACTIPQSLQGGHKFTSKGDTSRWVVIHVSISVSIRAASFLLMSTPSVLKISID